MNYNKDITHCSGYFCPIADKCLRFELFKQWSEMVVQPYASFQASQYNHETNECLTFYSIEYNEIK